MQMIAGTDFSRRRRGPFLAPIEIVVLATMVGALLFLLFPGRDFENQTLLSRPDDVSMAYLRMLLRAHPNDADARLLLAQQQMTLGYLEDAHETLLPLLSRKDTIGQRAEVVALKLNRTRLYAIPPDDPNRAAMQKDVHAAARSLIPRTTRVDDLAELADFVLSMGDPAEAARAYHRLSTLDLPNAAGWLEKAGRWGFAAGDPGWAAKIYSEAALGTQDARQGARLARLTLQALLAANQGRAGLAVARPLVERYPKDLELLEQAVRMAVAAGDLSTARRWGEQRVIAAGSSDKALREQIDILTKAGDPEGAHRMAKTLLARNPGDTALRRQMAQLARWSGQAEEALTQWAWLARRGNEDARQKALELAQALADVDMEVEMLELRMRQARRAAAPKVPELEQLRRQRPQRAPRVPPFDWTRRRRPTDAPSLRLRRIGLTEARATGSTTAGRRRIDGRRRLWAQASPTAASKTTSPASPSVAPAPATPSSAKPSTASPSGPSATATSSSAASTSAPAAPDKTKARRPGDFELTDLVQLADALEAKGLPDRAVKAMDDFRFNFADRPEYWVRIARLYENSGELEQALACLEQLARLKAMNLDDGIRQAKLLWRLMRPEAALTRLVGLRGQARETEMEYWQLVGDLAWRVENDLLAAEAYGVLWRRRKSYELGENLVKALDSIGRSEEAITIAEEAYKAVGHSNFLVTAVDIAVRAGMLERAKSLFAQAKGKEKQFELETHFFFQRAQLAIGEERASEAEADLQRVLAIDPGSEEAHIEWLTLAVQVQNRRMAERALRHWGPAAEEDPGSWSLLADAYTLLNDEGRAGYFRRLARELRIRERIASGRPMTPEEHLEEAIERKDRVAVENGLRLYGGTLSLPMRVAALRSLGRHEPAWDLITAAGLLGGQRQIPAEEALALGADVRDLKEMFLDGAWVTGGIQTLGALEERNAGARFELRLGYFFLGLEGGYDQLTAPDRSKLIEGDGREWRGFVTARMHQSFGSTTLKAGFEFLPEGERPHVELAQRLVLFSNRVDLSVRGFYGQIPRQSALLRVVGLRDGGEADATVVVAGPFELGGAVSYSQIVTRYNELLTDETSGRAELAFRLPFKSAYVRPRLDVFKTWAPPLEDIPDHLNPRLTGKENTKDILALGHSSMGIGMTFAGSDWEVGAALGPHVSLRYALDGWAGYASTEQAIYAADGAIGLVFARHHEVSLRGFYYSDFLNAADESFWGGSLNYTVRWFR